MKTTLKNEKNNLSSPDRRSLLKTVCGVGAAAMAGALTLVAPDMAFAASLTKEQRDKMTPDEIIAGLKKGNRRFRKGKPQRHDYLAQRVTSAVQGQFPSAIILSCMDSRAPAEIIFDTGIGETFNTRVAGNISNDDIIGGIEYACIVVGAKVVLVMGHTSCGAVRGAIEGAKLGMLTGLLDKIKPAIENTVYLGERVGSNYDFVNEVAKNNVNQTIEHIRQGSPQLKELEQAGKIKIVGAMYNLKGGFVKFLT